MVAQRDKRFAVSSDDKKKDRADIAAPAIDPGADAWQKGNAVQLPDPMGLEHALPNGAQAMPPSASSPGR